MRRCQTALSLSVRSMDRQFAGADESGLYAGAEQWAQHPPLHYLRDGIFCSRAVSTRYTAKGVSPRARLHLLKKFGTVELQKELAKDIPKVKVKVTAFARITKDMQRVRSHRRTQEKPRTMCGSAL